MIVIPARGHHRDTRSSTSSKLKDTVVECKENTEASTAEAVVNAGTIETPIFQGPEAGWSLSSRGQASNPEVYQELSLIHI